MKYISHRVNVNIILILAIVVLNKTIEQDTGHGDSVAREIWVVVHSLTDLETGRRIPVPGQEREDVVLHETFVHDQGRDFREMSKYNDIPHHRDGP